MQTMLSTFARTSRRRDRVVSTVCFTVLSGWAMAACGGGGSGTPVAAPTNPVAVPATPAQPVTTVPTIQPGNWVVMGSSTAAGVGAAAGRGWVALLGTAWAGKGAVLVNIAKGGIGTYEALGSATAPVLNRPLPDPAVNIDQALARKPVLLILAFPTNDVAAGYSVDEIVSNLVALRARALATSVPVVVLSTQPRDVSTAKLSQLREIDERLLSVVGTCFVPVRAKLAGPDDKLASIYDSGDGIHPNEIGHAVIADAVDKVLRSDTCVHIST